MSSPVLDDAEVLRLRTVEGLTAHQVAARLGVSRRKVSESLRASGFTWKTPAKTLPSGLVERFEAGESVNALSKETGMARVTLTRLLREAGCDTSRPNPKLTAMDDEVVRAYLAGMTVEDAAAEAGVCAPVARDALLRNGVEIRVPAVRARLRREERALTPDVLRRLHLEEGWTYGRIAEWACVPRYEVERLADELGFDGPVLAKQFLTAEYLRDRLEVREWSLWEVGAECGVNGRYVKESALRHGVALPGRSRAVSVGVWETRTGLAAGEVVAAFEAGSSLFQVALDVSWPPVAVSRALHAAGVVVEGVLVHDLYTGFVVEMGSVETIASFFGLTVEVAGDARTRLGLASSKTPPSLPTQDQSR